MVHHFRPVSLAGTASKLWGKHSELRTHTSEDFMLNTVYICLEQDIFLVDLPMSVKCHWYLWLPEVVNECDKQHVQPSQIHPHCNESREILWKMFAIKPRISTHYILVNTVILHIDTILSILCHLTDYICHSRFSFI